MMRTLRRRRRRMRGIERRGDGREEEEEDPLTTILPSLLLLFLLIQPLLRCIDVPPLGRSVEHHWEEASCSLLFALCKREGNGSPFAKGSEIW